VLRDLILSRALQATLSETCRGGKCAHINSFVILVLKGSPVIQRAHRLYVIASGPKLPGVPNHHASNAHSIFGSIAVIVQCLTIYDGIP
jgi:hypothetical protein